MNLREIDLQKRVLEAKYTKPIRAIFSQMNKDAIDLYKVLGNIPAEQVAKTYTSDFTKVVRDAMRESIAKFGFLQRKTLKNFDQKNQANLNLVLKALGNGKEDEILSLLFIEDSQLDQINLEYAKNAVLFLATESERQALYIQNTNTKELTESQQNAIIANAKKQAKLKNIIQKLTVRINVIRFSAFAKGESAPESVIKLQEKLTRYQIQLNELESKQKGDIAKGIEENLQAKEEARAELIASTSVGIAESWARDQEAGLLAIVLAEEGISLKKRWVTLLDGRERPDHHAASGQTVDINQKFIVGGEQCDYPRQSTLSAAQLIKCRCSAEYLRN
tara:strand:+ start:3479 stop:4480 length:1002 start_codon:yes stop_codon:yes gene_type:complete